MKFQTKKRSGSMTYYSNFLNLTSYCLICDYKIRISEPFKFFQYCFSAVKKKFEKMLLKNHGFRFSYLKKKFKKFGLNGL